MQLTKDVNNFSESVVSNSSKSIKFSRLQKIMNQLILHGGQCERYGINICSCFYESKEILGCLMKREKS